MKTQWLFLLVAISILIAGVTFAQETTLKLPTNDNTSSFNVTKNNGTSVLKVDGSGRMTGDGSGLSNLKSLLNSIGGDQRFQITANYGSYNNVRSVTLTVPSNGSCLAMASGYVDWESIGWDVLLMGILMDQDPNTSWDAEDEWYDYLNILTDYNCPDSSDQYTSFAQHRVIPVSAGTHTFYLWANKHSAASITEVADVNLTVAFFPSGGTGGAAMNIASTYLEESDNERINGSVDGNSPHHEDNDQIFRPTNDIGKLEREFIILKQENKDFKNRLDAIEKLLLEKK
ncbi:hypothetical protein ACFLQT_00065 [Bacteroidota bacterium]